MAVGGGKDWKGLGSNPLVPDHLRVELQRHQGGKDILIFFAFLGFSISGTLHVV